MITISEAKKILDDSLPEPVREDISLSEAAGRVLYTDLHALEPSPRYTNSAMDGFAVRWADIEPASRGIACQLALLGESQAGIPFDGTVGTGQAVRISTGAKLPDGADAVVPIEECTASGNELNIEIAHKPKQNIRFEGEEFTPDTRLIHKNVVLNPVHIALLASQGIRTVPVYRPARVAIIVTGTELVPYDAQPKPWQIRDSNGIMLTEAVLAGNGAIATLQRVGDDYEDTVRAAQTAAEQADIVIFSGGVSVGPHDLVKKAAAECGFERLFWRVRQRPGKPLFVAQKDSKLLFGLPGNPVSAYMCFLFYVTPVLRYLAGHGKDIRKVSGVMNTELVNKLTRAQMYRVMMRDGENGIREVIPIARQGSHMLTSVSDANGFILLEVGQALKKGDKVEVIPFS